MIGSGNLTSNKLETWNTE